MTRRRESQSASDERRSPSRRKELRQIGRDRRTLIILLFVPAMFLLLYGYALNFDIRNIALAVEDRDRIARRAATLVSAFVNSGYFDLVADVTSDGEIERLIDRNQARAALVIPAGFGHDVLNAPSDRGAGHHRRRQLEHGDHGHRLRAGDRRRGLGVGARSAVAGWPADAVRSRSNRASGTTRSCAARCSWCPA